MIKESSKFSEGLKDIKINFKKKEKDRKTRIANFIMNKRKKRPPSMSKIEEYTRMLIKKNAKDEERITTVLNEFAHVSASDKYKKFYKMIVTSKVVNGSMNLSDLLTNTPIELYVTVSGLKTKTISNDILFLHLMALRQTESVYKGKADRLYLNYIKLKSVQICSYPFTVSGTVQRGYYQDFSENFAAIGFNGLEKKETEELLNFQGGLSYKFTYEGKDYKCYGNQNACLIYLDSKNKQEVKDMYEAMKNIYLTRDLVSLGVKKLDSKDRVRFIDCKLKPERFCPAFLTTPNEFEFQMLAKYDYDYNGLFNSISNKMKTAPNVDIFSAYFPPNFFMWKHFRQSMDFVGVLAATGIESKVKKEDLMQLYGTFVDNSEIIEFWRVNQMAFERVFRDFYNAFNIRISYDKLVAIENKLNVCIDRFEELIDESSGFKAVREILEKIKGAATYIYKQIFNDDLITLARQISDTIKSFRKGSYIGMVKRFKELGLAIYNLCLSGTNENKICLPFIVSPGAFLGYVKTDDEENEVDDILAGAVNRIQNERNNEGARKEASGNFVNNVLSQIPDFKEKFLRRFAKTFAFGMSEDQQKRIQDAVVLAFAKPENKRNDDDLQQIIVQAITDGRGPDELNLTNGLAYNLIKRSADYEIVNIKKDILDRENRMNQIRQNQLENQQRMNALGGQGAGGEQMQAEEEFSGIGGNIPTTNTQANAQQIPPVQAPPFKNVQGMTKNDIVGFSPVLTQILNSGKYDTPMQQSNIRTYLADIINLSNRFKRGVTTAVQKSNNLAETLNFYKIPADFFTVVAADYYDKGLPSFQTILEATEPYKGTYANTINELYQLPYDDGTYIKARMEMLKNLA